MLDQKVPVGPLWSICAIGTIMSAPAGSSDADAVALLAAIGLQSFDPAERS